MYLYRETIDFGRTACSCICGLLLLGPVVIAVGLAVLSSSTVDSRGAGIASYNAAVANWTAAVGGSAAALGVRADAFYVGSSEPGSGYLPLTLDTAPSGESPPVESSPAISSYTTRISLSGSAAMSMPFNTNAGWIDGRSVTLALFLSTPGGGVVSRSFPAVLSASTSSYANPNGGDCENGRFVCNTYKPRSTVCASASCQRWMTLSAICAVADPAAGTWSAQGCIPPSSAGVNRGSNAPDSAGNTLLYTVSSSQPPFATAIRPSVRVKSIKDPWVQAMSLTDRSGNFGLTVESKRGIGATLLVAGVILLSIPPLALFVLMKFCAHRRLSKMVSPPSIDLQQGAASGVPMGAGAMMAPMPQAAYMQQPMYMPQQPGLYPQQQQGVYPQQFGQQQGMFPQQMPYAQGGFAAQPLYPQQQGFAQGAQGYPPQEAWASNPYARQQQGMV